MNEDTYKTEILVQSKTDDGLIAPPDYLEADRYQRKVICNGCGTKGWKGAIVPDTIWGLDITECCNIHDWMYHYGMTDADKFRADVVFLLNMLFKIESGSSLLKALRRYRAMSYYTAVADLGKVIFVEGKTGINV